MPATFTGEGASVKWRAPKGATTPADYAIRLTVTETYGAANAVGGSQQNIVNATSPVIRLHDSPKELGDLSMSFLGDFANSSVSPSTCVTGLQRQLPREGRREGRHRVEPGALRHPRLLAASPERHRRRESDDGEHVGRLPLHVPHHQVRAWRQRVRRRRGRDGRGRLPAHRGVRTAAVVAVHQQLRRRAGAWVPIVLFFQAEVTLR